jgi:hypothetical protein
MLVKKETLINKIEPFIYDSLEKENYEVDSLAPDSLLTWNRLDLAFKLFFLKNHRNCSQLAEKVYYEDIRSQTMGGFKEIGNKNKSSFEFYKNQFLSLYQSIVENEFDRDLSIIPLSKNHTIINGAHRSAVSILLKKKVFVIDTEDRDMICDYNYFYERKVPEEIIEIAVNTFIDFAKNIYIAFLWPSGIQNHDQSLKQFKNILYKKNLNLSYNGAKNLLFELYKHMDWVDGKGLSIQKKLLECFPRLDTLKVIAFQAKDISEVREIKEKVREINGIGFSSIHITDTKEEAQRISDLIFNANGLHFLNHRKNNKNEMFINKINSFKSNLRNHSLNFDDFVLDSGIVLEAYGIRESRDIDCFTLDKNNNSMLKLDFHDLELVYHKKEKNELIYNPLLNFKYEDLKFVSFMQVFSMKSNRNEKKDRNDINIMKSLIEDAEGLKFEIAKLKQTIYYFQVKVKHMLISPVLKLLRKLGLYNMVRSYYRKFKGD